MKVQIVTAICLILGHLVMAEEYFVPEQTPRDYYPQLHGLKVNPHRIPDADGKIEVPLEGGPVCLVPFGASVVESSSPELCQIESLKEEIKNCKAANLDCTETQDELDRMLDQVPEDWRPIFACGPALGLRKVLVTCGDSNLASARVIEKAGGVLEDVRETELGLTRRYWITL